MKDTNKVIQHIILLGSSKTHKVVMDSLNLPWPYKPKTLRTMYIWYKPYKGVV